MDHSNMNHSAMGHHAGMDHSMMDHSGMDHSGMDHSGHEGHGLAGAVVSTTVKAIVDAVQSGGDHGAHMMHTTDHGDHDMGMDMDMDMSMTFHFGYNEVILFDFWKISTIGGLIGSMVGIFILAMLYEGLKYFREHLFRQAIATMQYCANVDKNNITDENKQMRFMEQIIMPPTMSMLSKDHVIQTLMHMLQMIVSYLLMLIFMTYNVWLCLACVLGAGLGYFLFGWRKSVVVDITEHCH
ncbi:LOW QUALITY PROTEIN: high affinity copper uptake protein 1-like [Penaeus monodon]|uniref:LOW QUALITY PROTEIN: high affinity copper uptake protein 1-like n=1 Tax=Penaeus monodon TaxID=6687 RepID=UPI0018A72C48|nr:LOW QUALITY PROTEIN: high affinity copper uptake protein 1-like [Penaeus monodon]